MLISIREVQIECYMKSEEQVITSRLRGQVWTGGGVVFELRYKGWVGLLSVESRKEEQHSR